MAGNKTYKETTLNDIKTSYEKQQYGGNANSKKN